MPTLRDELVNDPLARGYSTLLPDQPGVVADSLNRRDRTAVRSRIVTARTVIAEIGPSGAVALWKLRAFGLQAQALQGGDPQAFALAVCVWWAVEFLTGEGVDVGHVQAQQLIAACVGAGVLTASEADALKALAVQPVSRADELGLSPVTDLAVMEAFADGLA